MTLVHAYWLLKSNLLDSNGYRICISFEDVIFKFMYLLRSNSIKLIFQIQKVQLNFSKLIQIQANAINHYIVMMNINRTHEMTLVNTYRLLESNILRSIFFPLGHSNDQTIKTELRLITKVSKQNLTQISWNENIVTRLLATGKQSTQQHLFSSWAFCIRQQRTHGPSQMVQGWLARMVWIDQPLTCSLRFQTLPQPGLWSLCS